MHALLSDLTKHATVIIDAPPLLPVTDGAVLTHQADGALVVVTLGKTTRDLLDKALDTLHKARGRALGIVLNKAPLRGVDASPYAYDYRREYATPSSIPEETPVPAGERADARCSSTFSALGFYRATGRFPLHSRRSAPVRQPASSGKPWSQLRFAGRLSYCAHERALPGLLPVSRDFAVNCGCEHSSFQARD